MADGLPKVEVDRVLPGWGSWASEQREPRHVREQRQQAEKLQKEAAAKRAVRCVGGFIARPHRHRSPFFRAAAACMLRSLARRPPAENSFPAALSQDAKKPHVVISERMEKSADAYNVTSVPFPYTSREVFEGAMRMPLVRDPYPRLLTRLPLARASSPLSGPLFGVLRSACRA